MRSSVFEVIRRHLSLPVNVEYEAMKTVLRELRHYNEFTSLHKKPTFYAELQVQVTHYCRANSPKGQTHNELLTSTSFSSTLANRERLQTRKVVPLQLWTAVLPWETQRGLSFSNLREALELNTTLTNEEAMEHEHQSIKEKQELTSEVAKDKICGVASDKCHVTTNEQSSMEDEWDDPLTVISYPSDNITNTEDTTRSMENTEQCKTPLPPYSSFLQSSSMHPASHTPGMLFLMKVPTMKEHGLHFWSGAITHSIDVLFAAALSETAINASYSFSQLRQELAQSQVSNNDVDPRLLGEYFPVNELHSSNTQLSVTSYGHLDPFPECALAVGSGNNKENNAESIADPIYTISSEAVHDGMNFNYNTNKMERKLTSHYVLETLRHVTQDIVQQALDESASAVRNLQINKNQSNKKQNKIGEEGGDVEIELRLELSQELKSDLLQKAQLACRYVPDLEECIVYHLRRRHELSSTNTHKEDDFDIGSDGKYEEQEEVIANYNNSHEEMSSGGSFFTNPNEQNASRQGKRRKIQVWLSEHESVWMTEDEVRAQQHAALTKQNVNNEANRITIEREDEKDDDDAYMQQSEEEQVEEEQDEEDSEGSVECATMDEEVEKYTNRDDSHDDGLTISEANSPISIHNDGVNDSITNGQQEQALLQSEEQNETSNDGSSSLKTTKMRPYSPRSLASQSPMLAEEDEAKPPILTPSFVGRHSGNALHQVKEIVNARHLSRYVHGNPEMPQDASIDYELFELCIRLNVAVETVLMCYYERLMREWRQELWCLRRNKTEPIISHNSGNTNSTTMNSLHYSSRVNDDDVQRMYALVHDASLQLPEELKSVVNAVARLRNTLEKDH